MPAVNALLNGLSAIFLVVGLILIKRKAIRGHRSAMIGAFSISAVFLISYVIYHLKAGHVVYQGAGIHRAIYFSILISHTILAAIIVPLILRTLYLAAKSRFSEHRQWARWTFPLWLYVSVTGVVIYEMLY